MRLLALTLTAAAHAFVTTTPALRRPTQLHVATSSQPKDRDTAKLQKVITGRESEMKMKQAMVSKLEIDLANAREAQRVAEEELRSAKQELAGVVPMNKKSRREEFPINTNVDSFVQEAARKRDAAAAERRSRDEASAEQRFREAAARRRERAKARSARDVEQAKQVLEQDAERELYGETLYDLLGVARDADAAQIKQAYRTAAKSCHPDTNSSNPEKYARVQGAYDVLKDAAEKQRYDAELDLDTLIDGSVSFVASVVDSVGASLQPEAEDDACDISDTSLACQFEQRAEACLEVFSGEHMVLPSTGSRMRITPDGAMLVVRQTAVERLLQREELSYNITSLKLAMRSQDVLTLGFLDATELRILFASQEEAEAALLRLARDVVAPLNELRAKAAAPGAIGALGGLAMAGAAGLAFAGILEIETAMATAGAVAALGGAVASSVAAEVSSKQESEPDA